MKTVGAFCPGEEPSGYPSGDPEEILSSEGLDDAETSPPLMIVNHQFNHMHPWCSWECMLPGRCSPGKGVTPFGIGISCCYPYLWVK